MATFNANRKRISGRGSCGNCRIPVSWIDICEKQGCHSIVYKPWYRFWPGDPAYLTEYDFFEPAIAYVSPPNWDQDMEQSCGTGTWNCSPTIPYQCVSAASSVQQVGTPKQEFTERFLRNEDFPVTFAWYGARRNPLYPGTYGAPQYIRELIPQDKLYNNGVFNRPRRVYEKRIKIYTQYKGWINCTCGEPAACGC